MADVILESAKFAIPSPSMGLDTETYSILELYKEKIDAQQRDIVKLVAELKDINTRLTNGGL